MATEIEMIISGNLEEVSKALQDFLKNNAKEFTFNQLSKGNKRSELWNALFNFVADEGLSHLHEQCLAVIRILSRDKTHLDSIITEERLELLLRRSHVKDFPANLSNYSDNKVAVEALKCLCNIIYNSPIAAAICSKNGCVEGIMERSKMYKDPVVPIEIKTFDMKILFLITALCNEVRPKLKQELHGLKYLTEILESTVSIKNNDHNSEVTQNVLVDQQVDLLCEILKVLFNLTVHSDISANIDEEEEAHYMQLVAVLRCLLLKETENDAKKTELVCHTSNLLTNMPSQCYKLLVVPIAEDENVPKSLQYEGQNMKAIDELLTYLKSQFSEDVTVRNQQEILAPVLTTLLKAANSSRVIRKYLRIKILPPLRDVHSRPEQGDKLRNCLCRLLTTPITNVRDLTADFLFLLCKENVGRMIKYTGYGNAAGLFAQRGLLGGGRPEESRYSSDSENSDTEEYQEHRHGINPVIGCYEPPHPNPTAGMTEEQKEYEVMKLVNLMDDLTRRKIVQPCKIGKDGRPQPIEHVMQLQEGLPNQQVSLSHQDDSD